MSVEDDRVRAYTAERRGEEKGTKEKTQRQGEESHERRPQEKREEERERTRTRWEREMGTKWTKVETLSRHNAAESASLSLIDFVNGAAIKP